MSSRVAWVFALGLIALSCRSFQPVSASTLSELKAAPANHLSGQIIGLRQWALMNDRDFVYTAAFSADTSKAAYSALGSKVFRLGIWSLEELPTAITEVDINPYQFDVEGLDFSPDSVAIATVSRDGGLRVFSARDGAPIAAYASEEPLVSVAFHPQGKTIAVGSAKGLVTLLSYPSLEFVTEERAHSGEVRALAFSSAGVLFSGGWDKSIASFELAENSTQAPNARLPFERRNSSLVVRGAMNRKAALSFALDAQVPWVVVTTEAAKAAGIDVPLLKESVQVTTTTGTALARVAPNQSFSFKGIQISGVKVAICDACVPASLHGILGAPFYEKLNVANDEATSEAVLTQKAPGDSNTRPALKLRQRLKFEWFVNDFSLDSRGEKLGVAFSEVKAERNRDIYEREKKGIVEPLAPGNAAAIVDAASGNVLKKWAVHHGVCSSTAISPDGQSLASGGWDKQLFFYRAEQDGKLEGLEKRFGWSVRRIRFSPNGRFLLVAAWTPQNAVGDQRSDPSAVVYELEYLSPQVEGTP